MAKRKRYEFDHYQVSDSWVLTVDDPWFKVDGCRSLFKFHRYVTLGARKWLDCWSETEGWRSLYVGLRPYEEHGLIIRPVKLVKPRRKKVVRRVKGRSK